MKHLPVIVLVLFVGAEAFLKKETISAFSASPYYDVILIAALTVFLLSLFYFAKYFLVDPTAKLGNYTVTSHVADAKMKKNGDAICTANFTVKEPPKNPPTMSCSANPASVQTGSPATITCTCTSPDGVPVTVAGWNATAGTLSGARCW